MAGARLAAIILPGVLLVGAWGPAAGPLPAAEISAPSGPVPLPAQPPGPRQRRTGDRQQSLELAGEMAAADPGPLATTDESDAIGATDAIGAVAATGAIDAGGVSGASSGALPAQASGCAVDPATLCLHGQRFAVRVSFDTGSGPGTGQAVGLTDDSGYFWFFAPSNVEVVVKTLDGCGFNERFWFFAGGLTNVHVSLLVTDTLRHVAQVYQNPAGTAFAPIQDTQSFATCP